MKKISLLFLVGLFLIFFLSISNSSYFLPIDILSNLSAFSQGEWQKPKNSLIADPVFQFEPWRSYAKERIKKGELPLWNNLNGFGAPFFANSQTSVLYPLQFFYYFLPVKTALLLIPVLKLYFYFWFIFLYLRSVNCSKTISIFGAVSGTFSAFPIVWLLWPHTNVFILLPLLLYLTEKIRNGKNENNYMFFLIISIVYCIGFFGGHPETLFMISLTHIFYSLFRLNFKRFKCLLLSIFFGFLLASIQIFPFIEYLLNSNSFHIRNSFSNDYFLPIQSFVVNFIPFIFGAPHQEFYKPIFGVNFQEAVGGYVGAVILLLVFYGIFKFHGNPLFRVWGVIVLFCWVIPYKIWPFWLVTFLPILNKNANNRFVGIAGFGLIVLFSLVLEQLFNKKVKIKKIHYISISLVSASTILLTFIIVFYFSKNQPSQIKNFLVFLQFHVYIITLSSWAFFITLLLLFQKNAKRFILILFIPLFFQTGFLLYSYNPKTSQYYPESSFISKLQQLPRGSILEVGNPNFPEDVNLLYHIQHAQNYDALEVDWYKKKFDSLFPVKNKWGNPSEVILENLQNLGISYVISDYHLNLTKIPYQTNTEKILPLLNGKTYVLRFTPKSNSLKQVRMLTANYNRNNTCIIKAEIVLTKVISQTNFSCKGIKDFMYYTFELPANLDSNKEYQLLLSSDDSSITNSIGLWGNSDNVPYIELLYDEQVGKKYTYLFGQENLYIFSVPEISFITMKGNYKNLSINPERVTFETDTSDFEKVIINQTFFPGWHGTIDGKHILIKNENPFVSLQIPSGKHVVSISYHPVSLFIGTFISFISCVGVVIYILRKGKNTRWFNSFDKKWNRLAFKNKKHINLWEHFNIFLLGTVCSAIIIFMLFKTTKYYFKIPKTTAINWLTVHSYPKQQDYFYIIGGTLMIIIFSSIVWFIWVIKRK